MSRAVTPEQAAVERRYLAFCSAVYCARQSVRALMALQDEVGALAAYATFDRCKARARCADDPPAVLCELMCEAVHGAERGQQFGDGKPWRKHDELA